MGEPAAELLVLQPGPHRRFALEGRTAIGVREDCEFRLFDPSVEPVHAVVLPVGDDWMIRSAAYIPCKVNDQPIVERVLSDRDVIQLGGVLLGFRRLPADSPAEPVAASLAALRDDVFAERAALAEERAHWEAELEHRRASLVLREKTFRDRAARTARAVQRERERAIRHQKRNEQRAAELDKLAAKLAQQQKAMDFAKTALKVEERHADAEFRKIEERRAVVGADSAATAARLASQKKELLRLDLEIERRRKDLERYAAPGAINKQQTLIEREFAAAAKEREAEDLLRELETTFREVDALLTKLERHAATAEPAAKLSPLRIAALVEPEAPVLLPMIRPTVDAAATVKPNLVAWADELRERASVDAWWDAREAEFQQEVRRWREDKESLLAEFHEKHHALNAAKTALAEQELRTARELARERTALHRERESLDRRRTWLDRAQQRNAALQAAAFEARLAPMELEAISAEEMIRKLKETHELWQQFRCDVLRERMELACERERWRVRDHELVNLRRLAHKQRLLLSAIVSDQNVRDRLWNCERRMREAAALERETAAERLAFALLDNEQPREAKLASVAKPALRKAA
jgi:hypothetical protein